MNMNWFEAAVECWWHVRSRTAINRSCHYPAVAVQLEHLLINFLHVMSSYHPLPTSESTDRLPHRQSAQLDSDQQALLNRASSRRQKLVLGLLFVLVAFAFFKAGQYSVGRETPSPTPDLPETKPDKDQPDSSDDPTMHSDGKKSVG